MKKYVETIITVEFSELSVEMTDEEMNDFEKYLPEFRERIKEGVENMIRERMCSNPDHMNVKVQVFLHN